MNQMEKINYLIKEYEKGNYRTETFCDQFEYIFFREEDGSMPEDLYNALRDYAEIFGRFSPYEEDIKTGALFNEERIKNEFDKMLEVLSALKRYSEWKNNKLYYNTLEQGLLWYLSNVSGGFGIYINDDKVYYKTLKRKEVDINSIVGKISKSIKVDLNNIKYEDDVPIWPLFDLFDTEIYSTYPNNTYANSTGTSMAAPFVYGIAALVASEYSSLNGSDLRNVIEGSVVEITMLKQQY